MSSGRAFVVFIVTCPDQAHNSAPRIFPAHSIFDQCAFYSRPQRIRWVSQSTEKTEFYLHWFRWGPFAE